MREPDPKILRAVFREVVENQLRDDDPPETRQTFDRLLAEGHPEEEVWRMISTVVAAEIFETMKTNRPADNERYVRRLRALPVLPSE